VADVWDELADAVATPSANPVISFTPAPTATPTPVATLTPTEEVLIPSLFSGFRTGSDVAKDWSLQSLRTIPEEGASIGGGIIGAGAGTTLGLALAPYTAGLSIPAGPIIGSALGSYADVPVQKAIDYFTGVTPTESRLGQATKEAVLGAGVETGVRAIGPLGKALSPFVKRSINTVADYFGPQSAETAQVLVGKELLNMTSIDALQRAAKEKEVLMTAQLPAETLTTAELTGSERLAQAERLLKTQSAGDANVEFARLAKQKLDDINQSAVSLTDLGDVNPKRAGQAAKSLLEGAAERQRQAASEKFTDEVRNIVAPIEGISKQAKAINQDVYQTTKVFAPEGELGELFTKIQKLEGKEAAQKAPAGFGRAAPKTSEKATETSVGMLQDLRSKALELSRAAPEGSRDELFANRIVDLLGKKIDSVKGTESLAAARTAWREYKQRWFYDEAGQRAPLNKLLRKQNPEDIIADVSKKSAASDEYAKVLGGLEPNKLAMEMSDFASKQTVDEKLKWIRSKRAVYADSPIWGLVQNWESILQKTKDAAAKGNVDALSPKNIDAQAASLVRALGGAERRVAASAGEAATLSAASNIARSSVTGALGGTSAGALMAALVPGVGKRVERSTDLVATALTQALKDPSVALKYIDDAAKFGEKEAAKNALRGQKMTSALEYLAPRAGAFSRSAGVFNPQIESMTPSIVAATATPAPTAIIQSDPFAELESALGSDFSDAMAVEETPMPTESSSKVGKQEISAIIDDVATKYKVPAAELKAIAKIESDFNPNAIGPKTRFGQAEGAMQLMPATAKALGVKDPFDARQSIEGASKLLLQLENTFGEYNDRRFIWAAYNSRPALVKNAIRKVKADGDKVTWGNVSKYMPPETKNYVRNISNLA
jgi:soluble lytic murein transglycosylase-like protein